MSDEFIRVEMNLLGFKKLCAGGTVVFLRENEQAILVQLDFGDNCWHAGLNEAIRRVKGGSSPMLRDEVLEMLESCRREMQSTLN